MRRAAGWVGLLLLGLGLATPVRAQEDERAYHVDAGDILNVTVPRYPEFSKQYVVSNDGTISLELVGDVEVRGQTPPEIERRLTSRLAEFLRYPEGVTVRVLARRMSVRVLGQVANPGVFQVPREANVQEILQAAGGPLAGAIMTQIVLRRRQGEWVQELPVDLKAYLEGHGTLPKVQNGDEIFVPRVTTDVPVVRPLGPNELQEPDAEGRVQVIGAVKTPGSVPVRENATILSALNAAGGWLDTADLARIRRVPGGNGEAEVFDLQAYLEHGGPLPRVHPGDVISVPSRLTAARTINVRGAVQKPGPVALPVDADVQMALAAAGGISPGGDIRHIRVLHRENGELVAREVDLEAYLASGDASKLPELHSGDTVFVPRGEGGLETSTPTVFVFGAVTKPGSYPLAAQRSLLHLLALAGGASPSADLRHIRITHADAKGAVTTSNFDLVAWQEGKGGELPALANGDTVTIDPNLVTVVGSGVTKPGSVVVSTRATVIDAIAAAGGPTASADLQSVTLTRNTPQGPTRETVNLAEYVDNPTKASTLPQVGAGDVITVQAGTGDQNAAYVFGAVQKPGPVALPGRKGSVLFALAQVGGVTAAADRQQVRVIRTGAEGLSSEVFDLKALMTGKLDAKNVNPPELHPGDVVSVEELGGAGHGVLVLGAVAKQGRVPVEDGQTIIDTIGMAGGLTPLANPAHARLVRATGESIPLNLSKLSMGPDAIKVHDGDTLMVAPKSTAPTIWDDLLRLFPLGAWFIRP